MARNQAVKTIKLIVLCVLATGLNLFISFFVRDFLKFPLYIDTVFTAAVAFAAGLVPGLAVAVLTWLFPCLYYGFNFFVFCSVAEVLLICALKPAAPVIPDFAPKEKIITSYIGVAAKLMLLYLLCAITISVVGGIINYVSQVFLNVPLKYFSVEDTFKLGLIRSNLPELGVNILSRIPVNIVDRFIVIFGGFGLSLLAKRFLVPIKEKGSAGTASETAL